MSEMIISNRVQLNYYEWSKRISDYHSNWLGFHLPLLNLNELFQTELKGVYTYYNLGSELPDSFDTMAVWIWDYVFSILKCKKKKYLSPEQATFLLEHLSHRDGNLLLGVTMLQTEEMTTLFQHLKDERYF